MKEENNNSRYHHELLKTVDALTQKLEPLAEQAGISNEELRADVMYATTHYSSEKKYVGAELQTVVTEHINNSYARNKE